MALRQAKLKESHRAQRAKRGQVKRLEDKGTGQAGDQVEGRKKRLVDLRPMRRWSRRVTAITGNMERYAGLGSCHPQK